MSNPTARRSPAPRKRTYVPKPRTPQRTAASPATPIVADTRPVLSALGLPGQRRAQEGRGGATAGVTMLRLIIRCPLLSAWAALIPKRNTGRRSPIPDLYWVFYLVATRNFGRHELLDQELREHWSTVREEFWFSHGVLLPDAKSNGDVPDYDDFNKWRGRNLITPAGRLRQAGQRLTEVSAPLAAAIRRAEEPADAHRDLLEPSVWDCMSADGTVMNAPSDVRADTQTDADGRKRIFIRGSRAVNLANARVHSPTRNTGKKRSGSHQGLFNVVAVTKGADTYTRVVLGVEIGNATEAEIKIAMRLLHQTYGIIGDQFPVLLYDGALTPVSWNQLTRRYGVYCVNANHARRRDKHDTTAEAPDSIHTTPGVGRRYYGTRRGSVKLTTVTDLWAVPHQDASGEEHMHSLLADDGGVYEMDDEWLGGRSGTKLQLLTPTHVERHRDERGDHYFQLTLTGRCPHGDFNLVIALRDRRLERAEPMPWNAFVANIRILPEALADKYCTVAGRRNHIESYFSWLEQRFTNKDRHNAFEIPGQYLDLIGAALLNNVQAWAHLALRHPTHADALATELAALPAPSAPDITNPFKREPWDTDEDNDTAGDGDCLPAVAADRADRPSPLHHQETAA